MIGKFIKQFAAVIGSIFVVYYVSTHYDSLKKLAAK
jgi:hypothetical protein